MGADAEPHTVCITGVTGFIAAFIAERCLQRGFRVRGTTRANKDPEAKCLHLRRLPGADELLTIVEADVMDSASLVEAFRGCDGVFHTATPVEIPLQGEAPRSFEDAQVTQIAPALEGVRSVFSACTELGITRVCLTSSNAAVSFPPPEHGHVSEACWSDEAWLTEEKRW